MTTTKKLPPLPGLNESVMALSSATQNDNVGILDIIKNIPSGIKDVLSSYKDLAKTTFETQLPGAKAIVESIKQKSLEPEKKYLSETIEKSTTPEGLIMMTMGAVSPLKEVKLDPVQKMISVLKEAKPVRATQEKLYTAERAVRFARGQAVGQKVAGEAGYYTELSQLKGELPKAQFESLRGKISQSDIDVLFKQVAENPWLKYTDTIAARGGLVKMFEGRVPTNSELELLNKVFPPEFMKAVLSKQTLFQKFKHAGMQLASIPRSVMSSMDFSFGGRQGVFAAPTFRKEFFKSWTQQFKNFGSKEAYETSMQEVVKNPYFNLAKESGVSFTNVGAIMGQREERFASQWAEKIPGVGASTRAYTGFANKFRMDIFESMIRDAERVGTKLTPKLIEQLANLVNVATGRGSLGVFSQAANILNAFFFSPRLMSSRIQILTNPNLYITAEPFARKQAIKMLLGFAGYTTTILTLAKLAGAEVETDMRNSDWGKIKIGNTRIDTMGGFQQYIRMAAQLITGEYVSSVTGRKITLGEGYKPITRLDILMRQVEAKEAPIFSFLTDLLKQKDYTGQPINIPKEIANRFIPMAIQDIIDLYKDDPKMIPLSVLGIFGFGLQTYLPTLGLPKELKDLLPKTESLPTLPKLPGL